MVDGMMSGLSDAVSHFICDHEAESKWVWALKPEGMPLVTSPSPVRLCLLKVPQSSQTGSSTGGPSVYICEPMGTLVLQATQEEGYIISQLQGAQSKAAWSLGQSIMVAG